MHKFVVIFEDFFFFFLQCAINSADSGSLSAVAAPSGAGAAGANPIIIRWLAHGRSHGGRSESLKESERAATVPRCARCAGPRQQTMGRGGRRQSYRLSRMRQPGDTRLRLHIAMGALAQASRGRRRVEGVGRRIGARCPAPPPFALRRAVLHCCDALRAAVWPVRRVATQTLMTSWRRKEPLAVCVQCTAPRRRQRAEAQGGPGRTKRGRAGGTG